MSSGQVVQRPRDALLVHYVDGRTPADGSRGYCEVVCRVLHQRGFNCNGKVSTIEHSRLVSAIFRKGDAIGYLTEITAK